MFVVTAVGERVRDAQETSRARGGMGRAPRSFKSSPPSATEFPGFFAYYSAVSNTVGNLYFGDGRRNEDLAFAV